MATEVAEPVVPDCRGDGRSGARSDADYPLRVLYCGGKSWELPGWGRSGSTHLCLLEAQKRPLGIICSLPTEYCEYMPDVTKCRQWLEKNFPDEFAKLTVGGRGQIKQKKKTVPQKVTIAKIPRAKKKYVTRVCGLATFEIDLKEAQRFFAQKFSCGASVTGEDEIIIQGDFTDDIIDVIQEKWPEVDDDSIEDLGEVKNSSPNSSTPG
ncbi:hypothetical protein DV515_00009301 [Chloebia gouldiae]|uniref:Density-regulated protein n=1 Tax=Chloebia gouldiae TaxID=44316 RepID=A0A3L8SCG6_CHLGU|nr:hypothetical protein DV515_00009301 [Chloebia gouldiae]